MAPFFTDPAVRLRDRRHGSSTLDGLTVGARGCVTALSDESSIGQRLMEMGLTEGTPIEVVRVAPFGDPIQIRVRGYDLSLRRRDARRVHIEAAPRS